MYVMGHAGERLVGELAPELLPMLATLEMPADFVPMTNTILAEMQRRGIGRDQILAELHQMGREIPQATLQLLQVGPYLVQVWPIAPTSLLRLLFQHMS